MRLGCYQIDTLATVESLPKPAWCLDANAAGRRRLTELGLIVETKPGYFGITPAGREALAKWGAKR